MHFRFVLGVILLSLACGCFNLKQPAVKVDYYQIEYELPNPPTSEALDVVLGIRDFTIASTYDHDRVIYKEETYERQAYYHHRWITNPSDMLKNALLKDFQNSAAYRAIILIPGSIIWDYEIQGHIHEILESDLGESWSSVIDLEITFIKTPPKESVRKVIFQKNYRHSAICQKKEPKAVVVAMSEAVKELSVALQNDVYKAVQEDIQKNIVAVKKPETEH